ncbi:competence protein ComFB [Thiospirochaeta perfilievii]|uniref:Competence protein ComFB n=1 Tax=Thiospirochaeta perfilievii TaxID=252967 RepID=A0A5C1QEX7_9SPIO|nr:late competence development ComFB family protein [Thiospirochaeta perfilievii]QEN06121.1 competence protein ComFB [Thiospirochaeta perfilievii]
MSIKDDYDFSIIENTIKEKVIEMLEEEFNNLEENICQCEECVIDMVCYALNRIKPNYTASLYGALYSRADADNRSEDIREKVLDAIEFVSSNRSHDLK